MALKLITGPTSEPLTTAEAKAHLRVDVTDDDTLIGTLIVAARQAVEQETARALMPQTWELGLDCFEGEIRIPRAPLTAISSIKYVDSNGILQTMSSSDYLLDDYSIPPRLTPVYGTSWPGTREQTAAVLIRFTAGYTNAAAVPQEIKQWMLLRIGMLYENRESVAAGVQFSAMPFVDRLLDAYRVWGM